MYDITRGEGAQGPSNPVLAQTSFPPASSSFAVSNLDHPAPGFTLPPGGSAISDNGGYQLVMQPDGNLVFSELGGRTLWESDTYVPGSSASLDSDGELVVTAPDGEIVYGSPGRNFGTVVPQDDGNLVWYDQNGRAYYATYTIDSYLLDSDTLVPGAERYSPPNAEEYRLVMQEDGNLVEYNNDTGAALWSTRTDVYPGTRAVMQTTGTWCCTSATTWFGAPGPRVTTGHTWPSSMMATS